MNRLLEWDKELFLYLNGLGTEFWDPYWLFISETKPWFLFYVLLLILMVRVLKRKELALAVLLVILNVVLTDQGSGLFKYQIMRLRPCHVEDLISQMRVVKEGCGGQFGFFSAHAANTFGLAMLLGSILRKYYSWLLPFLLVWAAIVSYSRIYIGVHYPIDVLCGAIFGILSALLMLAIYRNLSKRLYDESA